MDDETELDHIEKWLAASTWSEATLGLRAAGNARAIERIRSRKASLRTRDLVLEYIERNPVGEKAT
jgi:hypothetical protein